MARIPETELQHLKGRRLLSRRGGATGATAL